ncbi:MAG TPA: aconitate hydratase AcnA, partial [Allosphingosinicella sp.]
EAAMLGQPVSMLIPEVVGFKLTGALAEGITATDLVLTVTQMLRKKGVVGRFVEFYGEGVTALSVADRATIANMAPEYGATCGFFGVDGKTLDYLRLTGRAEEEVALVEAYAKEQGLWLTAGMADPVFTDTIELDMGSVEPSLAGPKRPQDKVVLSKVDEEFVANFSREFGHDPATISQRFPVAKGVVGRFVEFYGPGVSALSVADRATIANMAPEYGATCGFFPVDGKTLDYYRLTGRTEEQIALVEAYAKAQGLWLEPGEPGAVGVEPVFTDTLRLDMSSVEPSLAGPKRPQDKVALSKVDEEFVASFEAEYGHARASLTERFPVEGAAEAASDTAAASGGHDLGHGDVVIAAITSCTNTSNPSVLIAAGLVARKAREKGLQRKPWVKTSLAPGSQVVTDYLDKAGLSEDLDAIGFHLTGYGCTTCIGNSGPLPEPISAAINKNDLVAASVLSGNRNFEGRVSPDVRANFLASPPLVVAYALKGTVIEDMIESPIGVGSDGVDVYLKDIWPSNDEVRALIDSSVTSDMFRARYGDVYKGDERWRAIPLTGGATYAWDAASTYIANPPYFEGMSMTPTAPGDILGARPLAIFGDSITTDHISPAGAIRADSPAGKYLIASGIERKDFNSYGARRGNHDVMMRGTFANIRIRNKMVPGVEGGVTKHVPSGEQLAIYDAAMRYKEEGTPLVVVAGKEYGTGSSRDWAAKGTNLLGVRAVIAETYERIHRSNLVGMGVVPLQFLGEPPQFDGTETFTVTGVANFQPRQEIEIEVTKGDGTVMRVPVRVRIDTLNELEYFKHGGILHYVLRGLAGRR